MSGSSAYHLNFGLTQKGNETMSGRRIILLLTAVVSVGSLIASGVLSQKRVGKDSRPKAVTAIPPTYSKVKTLEILSTKLVREDTEFPAVVVEIRNNSEKSVMAVDLVCGEGAITKNGLTDEENPIVVIKPYGTTTIEMTFSEMSPDSPLVVSAATYSDGTEEGDELSLRLMHKLRDHDREMIRVAKEKARVKP